MLSGGSKIDDTTARADAHDHGGRRSGVIFARNVWQREWNGVLIVDQIKETGQSSAESLAGASYRCRRTERSSRPCPAAVEQVRVLAPLARLDIVRRRFRVAIAVTVLDTCSCLYASGPAR